MIIASNRAQKRALAAALADLDPEYLRDLKAFAEMFGELAKVTYQHNDPAQHARVVAAYGKALPAEQTKQHSAAQLEINAIKKLTG